MGQHQSTIYTSKPADVIHNLEWSLQEGLRWERYSGEAKTVLLTPNPTQSTTRGDRLGGIDQLNGELSEGRKLQTDAVNTMLNPINGNKKRRNYLAQLENSPLAAQRAIGTSASDIFAQGAAAQVASNIAKDNAIVSALSQQRRNSAPNSDNQLNNVNQFDGNYLDSEHRFASRNNNFLQSEPMNPLEQQQRIQTDRKNCIAKFLFIYELLQKCLRNSEYCYKLYHRNNSLIQELKRGGRSSAVDQNSYAQESKMYDSYLSQSLANFDRARATHNWAVRDYELSLALYKVDSILSRLSASHTQLNNVEDMGRASYSLHLVSLIKDLDRTRTQLYSAIHRNDRNALTLGFNYLDQQHQGVLTAEELRSMNPRTMRLLGVEQQNRLTASHLQQAIDAQTRLIEKNVEKIRNLEAYNNKLMTSGKDYQSAIMNNRNDINRLSMESNQASGDLNEIYAFFLQSFARHVFNQLDTDDIRMNELHFQDLTNELRLVGNDSKENHDPLQERSAQNHPATQTLLADTGLANAAGATTAQSSSNNQQTGLAAAAAAAGTYGDFGAHSLANHNATSQNEALSTQQPQVVAANQTVSQLNRTAASTAPAPISQQPRTFGSSRVNHNPLPMVAPANPPAVDSRGGNTAAALFTHAAMQPDAASSTINTPATGVAAANTDAANSLTEAGGWTGLPTVDQSHEIENVVYGRHTRSNSGFQAHSQPPLPPKPADYSAVDMPVSAIPVESLPLMSGYTHQQQQQQQQQQAQQPGPASQAMQVQIRPQTMGTKAPPAEDPTIQKERPLWV
jgi:hypothetical protein